MDIDIDNPIYAKNGPSKGNRVRTLLKTTDDATAAQILKKLWSHREHIIASLGAADPVAHAQGRFLTLIQRLKETDGGGVPPFVLPPPENYVLDALQAELLRIRQLAPQTRGLEFEKFLTQYFRNSGLDPREPFRNRGEQIDGSFLLGSNTYLVEAKYKAHPTGVGDLHSFHGKVTDKATWARGLFIAFEGFTEEGLDAFGRGKAIILMAGFEINEALSRRIPLREIVERKARAAAENGRPFNSIKDLFL